MIITDHVSKISLFTNHGRVAITNHVRNFSTFTVTLPKKRPITDHGKRSYPPSVMHCIVRTHITTIRYKHTFTFVKRQTVTASYVLLEHFNFSIYTIYAFTHPIYYCLALNNLQMTTTCTYRQQSIILKLSSQQHEHSLPIFLTIYFHC
jgi:hypothetical protein